MTPFDLGGTDHRSSPETPTSRSRPAGCSICHAREWEGKRLGRNDYVISADEKTYPSPAPLPSHPRPRPDHATPGRAQYDRGGALQYLAAWDVHRAKIFGRCEPKTGIAPFARLVEQVMTIEPYASARRVFWVVDNGSSHRGQTACHRLNARWPNAILVQLPIHASWLNQVEIYNSIIQRKVLTPNDFVDLADIEQRLAAFERRYSRPQLPSNGSSPATTSPCSSRN